ncbi:MAG: amidohydrolase family protein [Nitrospinaceae bacterium]|jgi:L-fuconolactonase|nr:amidohydrolase family protein [Nitrospinaceae bacterium]MBT3435240.1 amidohydrolase family protein [Nitrospinaceae bacterium]MBT3821815.1 amidohydrolase family protein [Nitrospinaceae bacterium]MBT4092564.1 amidohydrolase family protein [Nitrospinaceae bacterium]MBT4428881.1 amidohydrolase family protein [Nitrospinaceae bacterium]
MQIVDSQIHIWGANTPERPWPANHHDPHRPIPYSLADLIPEMNDAGVHRTVLVPPSWEGFRNDLALEAARLHPDRFGVMGQMDTVAPESRGLIAGWRQQPGMLGLRLTFTRPHVRPIISEGLADWLWKDAEEAGVPIMILIDWEQIDTFDKIVERHPGLKFVLDHLCIPARLKDEAAFEGLDKVLSMAKRPNVAVKATAFPRYSTEDFPYSNLHPYLRRVYDAFGPKRLFWGTDLTSLPCNYAQAVAMFMEHIPWLTEEDKSWIMGRAVCEWLEWPLE